MRKGIVILAGWAAAFCLWAAEGDKTTPAAEEGAQTENPFKAAKIGDWVKYRLQNEVGGATTDMILTMKITAKDEKEAVISTDVEVGGAKQESKENKVALDKPYHPWEAPPGGKVVKIAEGDEKIKVGDKEYDCHWVQNRMTLENQAMNMKSEIKVWFCKNVPLAGIVKMANQTEIAVGDKTQAVANNMEIMDSGRGE